MLICCLAPLPGSAPCDIRSMAEFVVRESLSAHQHGVSVILWPEYLWAFCSDVNTATPALLESLLSPLKKEKLFVLAGTLQIVCSEGKAPSNTALILSHGQWYLQDKIALAPREASMTSTHAIRLFTINGLRIATLICMDVEMPELGTLLKQQSVDILLVPFCVEDEEGIRRIAVCAEARSIELGCYTAICPLLGTPPGNKAEAIGDIQFFHPAQKAFANVSPPVIERTQILLTGTCPIDSKALRLARRNWMESTPSTSFCSGISVKSSDSES